ncbi:hypothetical protein TNCV_4716241 [Trichonephila clavipes]|nr:hypothetical protein TNCV_4716241 [Trichonephila clavipes]
MAVSTVEQAYCVIERHLELRNFRSRFEEPSSRNLSNSDSGARASSHPIFYSFLSLEELTQAITPQVKMWLRAIDLPIHKNVKRSKLSSELQTNLTYQHYGEDYGENYN